MNSLAISPRQQGKYTEAEAMRRQALQLKETVLGKDHSATLRSMNNLAISLRQQGKPTEAEAIHRQTLQLQETVLGKYWPSSHIDLNWIEDVPPPFHKERWSTRKDVKL
jgi:hypothetical protein